MRAMRRRRLMPIIIFRHYFAAAIFDATPRLFIDCRRRFFMPLLRLLLMPLLFFIFRLRHCRAMLPPLRHAAGYCAIAATFSFAISSLCFSRHAAAAAYSPPRRCAAAAAMLPLIFSRFRYLPIIFAFAIISPMLPLTP
jgi:hypothetical protein